MRQVLVVCVLVSSCGPTLVDSSEPESVAAKRDALIDDNGLSSNGLSSNGLSSNGLSSNGLSSNGLSSNGFATWFNANPTLSNSVMKYLVRCAVPAGQWRTFTDAAGTAYLWPGLLGLAPGWAAGSPATTYEQQIITACLAAHVNKYGVSVAFSIMGRGSNSVVPILPGELETFSFMEGCFFGNLFTNEGVFVGDDHPSIDSATSTLRACGIGHLNTKTSSECPPIVFTDDCTKLCTRTDSSKPWYETCRWNNKHWPTVTTRIMPSAVVRCGDGVCQVSERCGTKPNTNAWNDCGVDCGKCP